VLGPLGLGRPLSGKNLVMVECDFGMEGYSEWMMTSGCWM